jgi:hypothetical protein
VLVCVTVNNLYLDKSDNRGYHYSQNTHWDVLLTKYSFGHLYNIVNNIKQAIFP